MKIYNLLKVLLCVGLGIMVFSCEQEDDDVRRQNEEHTVTMKIYCNTADVPVRVVGVCPNGYCTIKNYYEETSKTKHSSVGLSAHCDDPNALITLEIYVDGKLRVRSSDNRYVEVAAKLK